MAKKDNTLFYLGAALVVVAGALATFFYFQNKKNIQKIKLLEEEIEENENLNTEIKKRLRELIESNVNLDPSISFELGEIAKLIENKQDTKAIASLAKIIENLLKELYKNDVDLKEKVKSKGKKSITFEDYLEHAKVKGVITSEDFHLLSVMKIIRNQESHELAIKKEKSRVLAALIVSFGTILSLWQKLKSKKTSSEVLEKIINV